MAPLSGAPFPPNKLLFLNCFHSRFLEPWCHPVNQPVLLSVFSSTTVIKDTSSTKGTTQCTMEVNSSSKMEDHIDNLQTFVVLIQMFCSIHCYPLIQGWVVDTDICFYPKTNKPTINETTACLFFLFFFNQ